MIKCFWWLVVPIRVITEHAFGRGFAGAARVLPNERVLGSTCLFPGRTERNIAAQYATFNTSLSNTVRIAFVAWYGSSVSCCRFEMLVLMPFLGSPQGQVAHTGCSLP